MSGTKSKSLFEIFAWYGTVAIVGAYFLISFNLVLGYQGEIVYQLLNLTGSFGVATVAYIRRVWQPVALNIIWAIIAAAGLIRVLVF
jgi:hypothetical protein